MNKNIILTIVMVVSLIMLSTGVQAGLEIISFTCNNMAPTANVETGNSMNCEAVIQNTDSQNSASVSSVKLYTTGGWSDAESYTGSDFSTTISAGGSTTAVFSNIIANVPGDNHKFSNVDIDDSAHTEEVTDLTVNSMTFKTLTVTPSVSSASSGTEFTVNSYLTAGGSISSASMTISLSGGCSLSTGESATKSLGSISDNVEVSGSWKITQGSSTCSITVDASGTSSPVTVTKTKSTSVSGTGDGGDGGDGGGGDGGDGAGAGAATPETTTTIPIEPGMIPPGGICVPNEKKCVGNDLYVCRSDGLEWTITTCEYGCDPTELECKEKTIAPTEPLKKIQIKSYGFLIPLIVILIILVLGGFFFYKKSSLSVKKRKYVLSITASLVVLVLIFGFAFVNLTGYFVREYDFVKKITTTITTTVTPTTTPETTISEITSISSTTTTPTPTTTKTEQLTGGWVPVRKLNFVDCLKNKDTVLYGASWCGDCREQISILGDYFKDLNYVNCERDFDLCSNKGIKEIPAWEINGEIYQGKFSLEEVRTIAGC